MDALYGDTFRMICELHLTYEDGEQEVVCSDQSWLCAPSPVIDSSIYDGEFWDSRKEIPGWAGGFCKEEEVFVPAVEDDFDGPLVPRLSPPVKIMERRKPVGLIHTPAGEQVLDFGQNMTGWVEFVCREPDGSKICLQFGEILQEGNFYRENLRTAKAEYHYISNGKQVLVRPHFTFYGFRYLKVEGISEISLEDFTACVLHTEMEQTGRITTSNPKINRLFLNALWGQRGNFLDTPTDCPQRDERMGWTGDAQVFAATASYNMYTPAFYRKYLYDMKQEQDTLAGGVPHVVPDILGQIKRVLQARGEEAKDTVLAHSHSSCAWGDAASVIPWVMYQAYGNRTLLEAQYGNMKAWTDYIRQVDQEKCGGRYLWAEGFHFADWLALDNFHVGSCFGATDSYFVASAYYYYSASLTAKAAKALGKEDDWKYYTDLAGKVKAAIQEEYFTKTGRLASATQTALALALYLHLAPEGLEERLVRDLMDLLQEENMHLTTGFVGTPLLCPVLAQNGHGDAAYTLLLNEDYPSWLYEVTMGATTIWERWNSVLEDGSISDTGMNSLNHYAYGSIVEWMYRYMCGVSCEETAPGYRRFLVKPYVDSRLDFVSMEYESAKGRIQSGWKRTENGYLFQVEVPFDTEAEFIFTEDWNRVYVNGKDQGAKKAGEGLGLRKGNYEICVEK